MNRARLLRAAAWLGACGIGLLGANAVAPVPAAALPTGTQLNLDHTALLPGSVGKMQSVYLYNYDTDFTLNDVQVTIETAGLAGVATATLEFDFDPCEQAGTKITCTFDSLASDKLFAGITHLRIRPDAAAKVGDEGEVSVKLTSRDRAPMVKTSKVTISEAVALEVGPIITKKAKPGDTFTNPISVRNDGKNVITGVDLFFFYEAMFTVPKRYDNCEYGSFAAYCHFDATLEAAQEYVLSEDLPLRLRPEVPAPEVAGATFDWSTPIDGRDKLDMVRATKPVRGTQGTLRLVKKPTASTQGPQTDTSYLSNSQVVILTVEGTNRSDVSAVGGKVSGAVGATVTARVGVKNLGPAYASGLTKPAAVVTFTPPTGTTVTKVPAGCAKADKGYTCATTVHPLAVNASATWDFGLRIDAAGELVGSVLAKSSTPDARSDNDAAKLIVNPAGGAGGGGEDPTLPITGLSGTLLGGAALALLAVGATLYLVARRRRTRFVP